MTSINTQTFEILVLTKCETIAPSELNPAQYALYIEATENGYIQTTESVGGKFDTTNGFQGMSEKDNLKVIMPTKTYAF